MIKLFVSDMDGTLLYDAENMHSKEMPLENKEAVLKLHASGVRFMMASGRDVYYRHVLEKEFGFQVDAIGMNGCNVVIDNEQLCNHGLSRQDAIDIIDTITHLPVKSNVLGITSSGDYVFQHLNQEPYEFFKNLAKEGIFQDVPDIDLSTWIHDESKEIFNKMVALVFCVEDRDSLFHFFKSHFDGRFDVIYSGPHNVEIMPKNISKGQALLELIQLKGYLPTEVAVIGDSMNDISMLQAVPYSFAMSHADDIVIHAAHYVVHSVKEAIDQVLDINEREKMKSNYHTHTSRCGHAVGSDEQYILAAIEAGLTHLGMSDHIPFKHFSNKSDRMDYSEVNDYLFSMRLLKEKYKAQIHLSIGFEVEYYPEFQAYYDELNKEVDYFICGQHYKVINEYGYDHYCSDEDLKVYADQVCVAMRSKQFLFLAHPDYFMLGRHDWNQASIDAAHQIAQCAQETGVPLEINLRGMKYGIKRYGELESYAYPFMPFWEIISQYQVKTVVSMDAHSPMNLFEFYKFETFHEDFKRLNLLPVEPYIL